ncbi:GNAT family N-acetyltransferase [Streptomyces silaceus]|uniref:GNAT family N-acetyltransferase n=1 Tax=Streptomyces silaceus TaxID=545123 RepID=UPI0006EB3D1B|nr:GNAT family N-acetyltransferase [Streptomyces silaceus]MCF3122483.1 GNAT family N-acetyltransferase [Streptomyces arenae]
MLDDITFRRARTPEENADVLRLRDAVYVQDQERLTDTAQTADTFDKFDAQAYYLLAYAGAEAVGTVKIVPDSPAGLPCEDVAKIDELRTGNRLVEFGHLMTLPGMRNRKVGMRLMREALVHSVQVHQVTCILGDFFVDDRDGRLRSFYTDIGFVPVHGPYLDPRFTGAPLSMVAALDVPAAARRCKEEGDDANQVLRYFFQDFDAYARGSSEYADIPAGSGRG